MALGDTLHILTVKAMLGHVSPDLINIGQSAFLRQGHSTGAAPASLALRNCVHLSHYASTEAFLDIVELVIFHYNHYN